MKIRMRYHVTGMFHGKNVDLPPGTVVDVPDGNARDYIRSGEAVLLEGGREERAVVEPGDDVESAVVKRPGRPRKQPEWHDDSGEVKSWKKVGD